MRTLALVGAGGKMGCRITNNVKTGPYKVHYLEVSAPGIERLQACGVQVSKASEALPEADIAILAVPDVALESVSREVVAQLKPGALVVLLDPAAPLDGKIAHRDDLGYFIAHPCHPSVFNWEPTEAAFRDFYGGISAKQAAVCALMKGDEKYYDIGVELTKIIYSPVSTIHRVTLEQMAMLEPALVETLAQTCMEIVKEGYDKVVAQGVPKEAVRDFVLGHLRIQIAVLFGEVNGTFSDAAYKISARAKPVLFKENWQRIFEMGDIREQVRDITSTKKP
ncbi:MAG TPA: phosphogluconate dehydrogenase C-terminal domain-containing protein [Methylomirabilota bacterium]|nr:phosphogluconate dehydrogenase C-terminal domain-containing protein [Methylomirabilota bacterium]